jgi:poly(ADP-ribose) glycohydrolase ARH3
MDLKKFQGALLGTFTGDALGMPFEGMSHDRIRSSNKGPLRDMKGSLQRFRKAGSYTDDTEMMIGIAEGLIEAKGLDCSVIGSRFAENFSIWRNYGPGTMKVLRRLKKGGKWDEPAKTLFNGEGSFGNGAPMRIAPIGCFFYDQPEKLRAAAVDCSRITHAHPLGIEGGVLQAMAVAMAVGTDPKDGIGPEGFVGVLIEAAEQDEYKEALVKVRKLLKKEPTPNEVVEVLGNDIRAFTSMPAALYSFLSNWESLEESIVYAVNLGGDTDTIGAMAGAIAGGLHGVDSIPRRWFTELENKDKGRDYVLDLGRKLWDLKKGE